MKCYNEAELESEKDRRCDSEPGEEPRETGLKQLLSESGFVSRVNQTQNEDAILSASRYASSLGVPCCPHFRRAGYKSGGPWRITEVWLGQLPELRKVLYILPMNCTDLFICRYFLNKYMVGPLCLWVLHQLTKHRSLLCLWFVVGCIHKCEIQRYGGSTMGLEHP